MGASQSRGSRTESRSHPRAQFIRFTTEENNRLIKLCRKRKLTVQSFMHAATMRALNEADIGKKTDAEIAAAEDVDRDDEQPTPRGLGIRERLQRNDTRDDVSGDDEAPLTAAAPSVQAHTTSADDEILALARTIVETPQASRRDALQAACRVLARGRTQEEAVRRADELDATIRRLDGVPRTALERVRDRMAKR